VTYGEYFEQHPDENMSWCKPYTDTHEENYIIVNEGVPIMVNMGFMSYYASLDGSDVFRSAVAELAQKMNPDYSTIYDKEDLDIALDAMHETGCIKCPFIRYCAAMYEEYQK